MPEGLKIVLETIFDLLNISFENRTYELRDFGFDFFCIRQCFCCIQAGLEVFSFNPKAYDAGGLYIEVTPSGGKLWRLNWPHMGLG